MSEALLRATGLHKHYPSGSLRIEVLRGLDLELTSGEAVAIVGDSGVGKSTLLHLLGALDRPTGGEIEFRGRPVTVDGPWRSRYRNRHVGFVFQFHHLLPEFTALENVVMPFRVGRLDPRAGARVAGDLLRRLGLADRASHRPSMLSGGEQQRVAIARAVAVSPDLVLADEPTGNLDPAAGIEVFRLLRELQRERDFALVLATHSGRLARGCDRILRLVDGTLRPLAGHEADHYFDGVTLQDR